MPAIDAGGLRLDLHGRFGDRDVRVAYSKDLLIIEGFAGVFVSNHEEYAGEQLKVDQTEIGRLVTVQVPMFSTRQTVSFSLLVPTAVRTTADGAGPLNVTALAVITNWQSPTEEHLAARYGVVELEGTASRDPG